MLKRLISKSPKVCITTTYLTVLTLTDFKSFPSVDVVAYSIGDFVAKDVYEIVTAWVDKRYRGMDLAVKVIHCQILLEILLEVYVNTVAADDRSSAATVLT
jgi:hypothetical protein